MVNKWMTILVFIGLSLNEFVLMMGKGATMNSLSYKKTFTYSLIFGITNILAVMLGYSISLIFKMLVIKQMNILIAVLCFFTLGSFFLYRIKGSKVVEEKLDLTFNYKKCLLYALYTSIGTIFVGVACSFIDIRFLDAISYAGIINFFSVILALNVGYYFGYRYARLIKIVGGVMMILYSLRIGYLFLR